MKDTYERFKDYDKEFRGEHPRIVFPPNIYNEITANIRGDVLDIGTGDGYKLKNILEGCNLAQIKKVVAMDPSPLYEKARERLSELQIDIEVYNCSLYDFPRSEKFDTILMFEVLEHMPGHDKALRTIAALLKPDGVFICSTPNRLIFRITERVVSKPIDKTHINEMTYKEFISLMDRHFLRTRLLGVVPFMTIGRRFPRLLVLNRYFSFIPISRTIYCFAREPRVR